MDANVGFQLAIALLLLALISVLILTLILLYSKLRINHPLYYLYELEESFEKKLYPKGREETRSTSLKVPSEQDRVESAGGRETDGQLANQTEIEKASTAKEESRTRSEMESTSAAESSSITSSELAHTELTDPTVEQHVQQPISPVPTEQPTERPESTVQQPSSPIQQSKQEHEPMMEQLDSTPVSPVKAKSSEKAVAWRETAVDPKESQSKPKSAKYSARSRRGQSGKCKLSSSPRSASGKRSTKTLSSKTESVYVEDFEQSDDWETSGDELYSSTIGSSTYTTEGLSRSGTNKSFSSGENQ